MVTILCRLESSRIFVESFVGQNVSEKIRALLCLKLSFSDNLDGFLQPLWPGS
jgi:hypothetical protein